MRVKKCKTSRRNGVNVRLLAFLLITTEIFILFISANGYGREGHRGDGNNHRPPPSSEAAAPLPKLQKDNISSSSNGKLEQVIRASGIEIATTERLRQGPNVSLEGHRAGLLRSPSSPYPLSSNPLRNNAETLDRRHHSSERVDVNAAAVVEAAASVAGWMLPVAESNPLIERHTSLRRNKRQLESSDDDQEEAALLAASSVAAGVANSSESEDGSKLNLKSGSEVAIESSDEPHNVQVNEPESPSEYRVYQSSRQRHPHHQHHHRQRYHGHSRDFRPHFSVENHEGASGTRFRDKNGFCHRDCSPTAGIRPTGQDGSDGVIDDGGGEGNNGPINSQERHPQSRADSYKICGSDGSFYGSVCELKRHSCRLNIHLSRRPKAFCFRRQQQQLKNSIEADTTGAISQQLRLNGSAEVRIVELKRRCNTLAYNEMKSLLLREFNFDLVSMFRYFDSNGDNFIEAHELWPRPEEETNKLRYAQVWDEHSSKCRHVRGGGDGDHSIGQQHHFMRLSPASDPTKCWFFLDFAFEPSFLTNPCSLSHLILFDLKHPNSRFDLPAFEEAFEEPRSAWLSKQGSNLSTSANRGPIKRSTRVQIMMGDSVALNCLSDFIASESAESQRITHEALEGGFRCLWTRYNLNLGAIQDPHINIEKSNKIHERSGKSYAELTLNINDAQLYLSGHFKCACHTKKVERTFEHSYSVQVLAEPRVSVRPKFQWSLPASRISFECHYDYIDTRDDEEDENEAGDEKRVDKTQERQVHSKQTEAVRGGEPMAAAEDARLYELGQFGLRVKWLKDNRELVVDSKKFNGLNQSQQLSSAHDNDNGATIVSTLDGNDNEEDSFYSAAGNGARGEDDARAPSGDGTNNGHLHHHEQAARGTILSHSSLRASITMAASRLTLENLTLSDSGQHTCRVEVPNRQHEQYSLAKNSKLHNDTRKGSDISPPARSIFGRSGGTLLVQDQPKSDQSGLDEAHENYLWMFHDNGISIYRLQNEDGQEMELLHEINGHNQVNEEVDGNWNQLTLCGGLNPEQVVICEWSDNALQIDVKYGKNSKTRKYIYVGQPNLNRIIVMDGLKFEIVAIINTEPQPRKLFLYKPSRIHLSKWVRRRLSPAANARWLDAIGTHAHSLKSTPDAKLYSIPSPTISSLKQQKLQGLRPTTLRGRRSAAQTNQKPSPLIQHDIWLLCYGQPLVVDPSGDEHLEEASRFYSTLNGITTKQSNSTTPTSHKQTQRSTLNTVQPFTPRLTAGSPFAWPVWPNKESKLRNRKSVHIVQSTFFPPSTLTDDSLHNHDEVSEGEEANLRKVRNETVVGEFKRSTVLTTHHVFSGIPAGLGTRPQLYLSRPQLDLIQDLYVPPKPYSLESNQKHKIHHAYVTHYDDRRLFRVSMDEYRYDREIDLQDCDPINLVTTAQGLLVIQCRAPIAHNLIGQMVLDQLTSSRMEFNANIKAQESYLSPDHRYLVSILNNSTSSATATSSVSTTSGINLQSKHNNDAHSQRRRSPNQQDPEETKRQSVIYVQLVTMSGLKLQYEIKTSLEISQCSFVWKDGYYAAIFVSTNRRDDQTEILSLRLADSRLQLMARVPGIISVTRHKDQLIVAPELRLAALSTNQGSYVVDLEDNRVSQSLRHHHSPPTLLWV